MSGVGMGIVVLVILAVVTLGQLFAQGAEHIRRHKELVERLDRLAARLND